MRRSVTGSWIAMAALVVGLLLSPEGAAAKPGKPLLIYGPGMPGEEAEADARTAGARFLRGARRSGPALHVSQVPFFGPAPLWAVGDLSVRPCSAAARDTAEIRELVELGKEQTDLLEQVEADETFHSAWLALECADDFVARDLLYEVHFYSGLSAYVAGDPVKAEASFVQAVATDPRRVFDAGYPPEIEALYDSARRRRDEGGKARLHIRDPERGMTAVWLDGRSVTGEDAVGLAQGDHLLQYRTRFDTFTSMQLRVTGEGRAALVSREGLVEALMDPGEDAVAEVIARAALAGLAEARELPSVVVVRRGDPPTVVRFDPESASLQLDAVGEGSTDRVSPHPRRVALSVSGGWLFYPAPEVAPASASYGSLGLQGEVPIVAGLALDLGLWLALRGAGEWGGSRWMYLLPSLRSGLHVNLATGSVRPYVGGAFHLAIHRTEDRWGDAVGARPAPGGVGILGIAFEATDHLRFHADLHGGYGGAPILQVSLGAGLRF